MEKTITPKGWNVSPPSKGLMYSNEMSYSKELDCATARTPNAINIEQELPREQVTEQQGADGKYKTFVELPDPRWESLNRRIKVAKQQT